MGGLSQNWMITAVFLGIALVSLMCAISISSKSSLLLVRIAEHDESLDRPNIIEFSRLGPTSNQRKGAFPDQQKNSTVISPTEMAEAKITPTVYKHSTQNTTIRENEDHPRNDGTLSLLYPAGLVGGYRNQAMRFIGLLRHAVDKNYDSILLPTLVWSTRYSRFTRSKEAKELDGINPVVNSWPIPFDELFDVDHWNTFSRENVISQGRTFSLPKLVSSIVDDENVENGSNRNVCWKPQINDADVSVSAIQRKHQKLTTSFLPLLTRRMLFGNDGVDENMATETIYPPRKSFLLDPVLGDAIEYLTGNKMAKRIHKVDVSEPVSHCTHPRVLGGRSRILWNLYLQIRKEAKKEPHLSKAESKKVKSYIKIIEKVDEALVPAKPWRILADQCIEHHLGLGEEEFIQEEEDPHVIGHDHGYIALHSRVEPEMLSHTCGKDMQRNLTTILDLVELLALDYNAPNGLPDFMLERAKELNYSSPISDALRKQLNSDQEHRPLKGAFVAIARAELEDFNSFERLANVTRYNRDVLNQRSMSYDNHGVQTYSETMQARNQKQQQSTGTTSRRLMEEKSAANNSATTPLPVFECGEGWVKHAFYESESRQKKLFNPTSASSELKDYGLYYKYGPQQQGGKTTFPLLPLPDNYFGDLLPSVLNFWLAVRADVFVGVQKSSWSTDVWTTRYYMGKGGRNFEYTSTKGIRSIGNAGLPEPHTNCKR
mmetsp:Transcript_15843/g.39791  ORF Transcript_15843/g.39791 Transcript_15843/m.39791 type:complete len:715 (+) Transcript_15843:217-2361(+)